MTMVTVCFQLNQRCVHVLVTVNKDILLAECAQMIRREETDSEYSLDISRVQPAVHSKFLFGPRPLGVSQAQNAQESGDERPQLRAS